MMILGDPLEDWEEELFKYREDRKKIRLLKICLYLFVKYFELVLVVILSPIYFIYFMFGEVCKKNKDIK